MAAKRNTKTADDAKPMTLAEVERQINAEYKALQQAENALAVDPRDSAADKTRREKVARLNALDTERESLQRVEKLRAEASRSEAEKAAQAEARKDAAAVPDAIRDNGKDFSGFVQHMEAAVASLERIEERNTQVSGIIRSLPGDERKREMTARAARTVLFSRLLRPVLQRWNRTKFVDPYITVTVPAALSVNPMAGESHREAQARVAALPATVEDVFEDAARSLQARLADLLGPPPASVEPSATWHGRSDSARPDSFANALASGALARGDAEQKERTAKRVKNSTVPIVRDSAGEIAAAKELL